MFYAVIFNLAQIFIMVRTQMVLGGLSAKELLTRVQ
jgi:hypothetical protein